MVLVDLTLAVICFLGNCYPALVGPNTPEGEFKMQKAATALKGYGGDVLMFNERSDSIDAVHRVWLEDPKQRRLERLTTGSVADRKTITNGCINVMPDVYDLIPDGSTLKVFRSGK